MGNLKTRQSWILKTAEEKESSLILVEILNTLKDISTKLDNLNIQVHSSDSISSSHESLVKSESPSSSMFIPDIDIGGMQTNAKTGTTTKKKRNLSEEVKSLSELDN